MKYNPLDALARAGISRDHALALRLISLRLRRWHENECGVGYGHIERDEESGKCFWLNASTGKRTPTLDRETGNLRRLAAIMAEYPSLSPYIQRDPRGTALYILRDGDVPVGKQAGCYYSRGIGVY